MPSCVSSTETTLRRPHVEPLDQRRDVAGEQRVQQQRRQREVVGVVDLPADLELGAVVRVNLDEDVDAEAGRRPATTS